MTTALIPVPENATYCDALVNTRRQGKTRESGEVPGEEARRAVKGNGLDPTPSSATASSS